MAKQNIAEPEALGQAMSKTELFFENNGRKMTYIFLALLVLGLAIYGYRALIVSPRAEKAAELIAEAQARFNAETPDFELALNGDANGAGFLDVVEQYGSTASGNLAKHYAGICYLRTGDLENAAAYLKKFKAVKGLAGAIIIGVTFTALFVILLCGVTPNYVITTIRYRYKIWREKRAEQAQLRREERAEAEEEARIEREARRVAAEEQKQIAAAERLHHRNAHAQALACFIKLLSLGILCRYNNSRTTY